MRFALLRAWGVVCLCTVAAFGQQSLTVEQVVQTVTSSIQQKLNDKEVASFLQQVRLSQKLEDSTIEALQTKGAGPRTVEVLKKLADQSAKLAPPPAAPPAAVAAKPAAHVDPPPSREVQERVLDELREYARNYTTSLPDFLCLEVTRRSINMHYSASEPPSWTPTDRLAEKLSFVDHKENYELISHNDNAMFGKNWEAVGGAMSRGDWATILNAVFSPQTETDFRWERWGNSRNTLCHVYEYHVDKAHSQETITFERSQSVTPAFHGEIFVPVDHTVIWRMTVEPDPPADFPIQDIKETLLYDYVDISGQKFLLPLSSDVVMRTGKIANRNEIAYRKYQKYSADTSITFDDKDDPAAANDLK
jgi:hypothetical protein